MARKVTGAENSMTHIMNHIKTILKINALSCIVFGLLFMFFPVTISRFFGNGPEFLIIFSGLGLFINGVHLWLAARRETLVRSTLYYFSAGNAFWAFLAVFMMVTGVFVTTGHGMATTALIAVWVAGMAVLQFRSAQSLEQAS